MKVHIDCENGVLAYEFFPESDDIVERNSYKMDRQSCEIHLPEDWDMNSVHPDILALVAILIVYPFCRKKIELPFGVSNAFHTHFKKIAKKDILPLDDNLQTRKIPKHAIPALAYSGGVDSTAALTLLPKSTSAVFLDRIIPENTPSLYNKEAAHYACETLRKLGRSVYMIKTDLEYIRKPVGFPIDVANAIPALLLADYAGFDSIAFGTVMTSTYRLYNPVFEDYSQRSHYTLWGNLFEIVGMPFNQVTAGMTEAGTTSILINSPYYKIAQSCMRGKINEPCMKCWKCFRKKLEEKTVLGEYIEDKFLSDSFKKNGIKKILLNLNPKNEIKLAYLTSKYSGDNYLMNLLKNKTRGNVLDMSWYEKWYEPSIDLLPEKYREYVKSKITKYLEIMNEDDIENIKKLDYNQIKENEEYLTNCNKFSEALIKIQ